MTDVQSKNSIRARLLRYWRNSLMDAERKKFRVGDQVCRFSNMEFYAGIVSEASLHQLIAAPAEKAFSFETFSSQPASEKEPTSLRVLVAPITLFPKKDHGRIRTEAESAIYPFWIPAHLAHDGALSPDPAEKIWIVREVLDPTDYPGPVIGTVADLDTFLTTESTRQDPADWADAVAYADRMWTSVTGTSLTAYAAPGFLRGEPTICLNTEPKGAGEALLVLYDKLQTQDFHTPLFDRLCERITSNRASPTPTVSGAVRQHFGHVSVRPLTPSQRRALYASLQLSGADEILAINGPPGTGKTTLLQSIIASLWVESAVRDEEPPVILVTSTNNRAVQNVIESLERAGSLPPDHYLSGNPITTRWLPDVIGYGLYLRSSSADVRESQNAYRQGMRWTDFVERVEMPGYDVGAVSHFTQSFASYAGWKEASVGDAVDELLRRLRCMAEAYDRLLERRTDLSRLATDYSHPSLERKEAEDHPIAVEAIGEIISRLSSQMESARDRRDRAREARDNVAKAGAPQGVLELLLDILPAIRMRRWVRMREILETYGFSKLVRQHVGKVPRSADINASLEQYTDRAETRLKAAEQKFETLTGALRSWTAEATAITEKYRKPGSSMTESPDFDRFETFLDTHFRLEMFHIAARYWEGRWLLDMEDQKDRLDRQGRIHCEARFRRFAKLTPCLVATPFMAARYFDYHEGTTNPLTDFIDLLIFDEAGQVRPDLGAAIFALAKRAVAVGDTDQIEPVWEVPQTVDFANLRDVGLEPQVDTLDAAGALVSKGSLMAMTRHASYCNDLDDRGIFLAEHFRCVPEIVSYCNALSYRGKLISARPSLETRILPAMGYAHIDSLAQKSNGSWSNLGEAQVIAEWLHRHAKQLSATYPGKKQLGDIVAIVTPFRPHAIELRNALSGAGLSDQEIITGTVHALQGAQRPVIIFSPAVSPKAKGLYFFDRGPNMLNVAVSRAEDSFLVFGNAALFDRSQPAKPSGLLAHWLFEHPENEITDVKPMLRFARREQDRIEHIDGLAEHRRLLMTALNQVKDRLLVVSPYISIHALKADNLLDAFAETLRRGVTLKVLIGSDMDLMPNGFKRANAESAIQALRHIGIDVSEASRIHYKTLAVDERWFVEGSFNWLSAVRDENSPYQRDERSLAYTGPGAAEHIRKIWEQTELLLTDA